MSDPRAWRRRKMRQGKILVLGKERNLQEWLRNNYADKLLDLYLTGAIPGTGVTHVDICHDDGCPALHGGICTCDPELKVRGWPDGRRN